MEVTTGFGYLVKDGLRISKYELPIGKHPTLPDGMSFVEVRDKETLEAINLDKTSEQISFEKDKMDKEKKRQPVIDKLKSLGFSDEEISVFVLR